MATKSFDSQKVMISPLIVENDFIKAVKRE